MLRFGNGTQHASNLEAAEARQADIKQHCVGVRDLRFLDGRINSA
jgi:hypothetical protein